MMSLEEMYEQLAEIQREAKEAEIAFKNAQDEANKSLWQLRSKKEVTSQRLIENMKVFKTLLLENLENDGVIPDMVGVALTNRKSLKYDEQDAVAWAIYNNFESILQVKKKECNDLIKSIAEENDELPFFVTEEEVISFNVATDLLLENQKENMRLQMELEKSKSKTDLFTPEELR